MEIMSIDEARTTFLWPEYVDRFFHDMTKQVVATLCTQLVKRGYRLRVWDSEGDEWLDDNVGPTQDLESLAHDLWATDMCSVHVYADTELVGSVMLINSNGGEVITDWVTKHDDTNGNLLQNAIEAVVDQAGKEWFK